jgi:hypothetical protein
MEFDLQESWHDVVVLLLLLQPWARINVKLNIQCVETSDSGKANQCGKNDELGTAMNVNATRLDWTLKGNAHRWIIARTQISVVFVVESFSHSVPLG